MKKAVVIRLGAFGDCIQITPVFRLLREEGYHVTFYCKPLGKEMVQHDPNIDTFRFHDEKVTLGELNKYLEDKIYPDYDRVCNMSAIVEKGLLKLEGTVEFGWSHTWRHRAFNKNYSDALMEAAGFPDKKGLIPELYFSPLEEQLAKKFMSKLKGKFVILWSLSGSSYHKTYPFAEYVGEALYKHEDIVVLTVGDTLCEVLEWHNGRTKNYSGKWPFRKSMILSKYVNLVIGTETGILNAASAFETPKVILLSHSSEENLTKYWKNTTNMYAQVPCYPCHCLNPTGIGCTTDPMIKAPVCMSYIHAKDVYYVIMKHYEEWRAKKWRPSIGMKDRFTKKMEDSILIHQNA